MCCYVHSCNSAMLCHGFDLLPLKQWNLMPRVLWENLWVYLVQRFWTLVSSVSCQRESFGWFHACAWAATGDYLSSTCLVFQTNCTLFMHNGIYHHLYRPAQRAPLIIYLEGALYQYLITLHYITRFIAHCPMGNKCFTSSRLTPIRLTKIHCNVFSCGYSLNSLFGELNEYRIAF